jgi:hypothetical protein
VNSNSKTNIEIIYYITMYVLFKFWSLLGHVKFSLLTNFLCPFNVSFDLLINLFLYIKDCLLILCSFLGNVRSVTAKQKEKK